LSGIKRIEKHILSIVETVLSGRFAEGERMIERLERRAKTPDERRIAHALRGILTAYQGDDRDSLIYQVFLDDDPEKKSARILESLQSHLEGSSLGGDAFFEAWRIILRNVRRLPTPHRLRAEPQGQPGGDKL